MTFPVPANEIVEVLTRPLFAFPVLCFAPAEFGVLI